MGVYNGEPIRPCTQRADMTDITITRLQSSVKNQTNKQKQTKKRILKSKVNTKTYFGGSWYSLFFFDSNSFSFQRFAR